MTLLLLLLVNVVLLLALAAVWESWRTSRRALSAERDGDAVLRVSCRPDDPALARRLVDEAAPEGSRVIGPAFGDRSVLLEGPSVDLLALRGEVARRARDEGFAVRRSGADRWVLRRGLRLLYLDIDEETAV